MCRGSTPLMKAAYYGHAPVCSQFLAAGAAVNANNARGLRY
jgi:ankyrin repeat protein